MKSIECFYEDLLAELHEISGLLSGFPGWRDFVGEIKANGCIDEIFSDFDIAFSADQKAVFLLWRISNVSVSPDGKVCNEYEGVDADEEHMLFSLRVWKEEEILKHHLVDQSLDFAGLVEVFRDYAPDSRQESDQMWDELSNR